MFEFKKVSRLLKGHEFKHVLDSGLKVVSPNFVLYGLPCETSRLGLIVSKKVGNAVVRNKVKRRLREGYRLRQPQLREKLGFDLVVIARHRAGKIGFHEFDRSLANSFERLQNKLLKTIDEK